MLISNVWSKVGVLNKRVPLLNIFKNEIITCRNKKVSEMVRILNVAEKNDAAKSIANIMANGRYRHRGGRSVYNKIYEFEYNIFNQQCHMVMTSVSGHLLNIDFTGSYKSWQSCNPVSLFEAPVATVCLTDYQPIKQTLEAEVRSCHHLIIWTDGDREGENIGFEIIEICKKVKPNIIIHRARFSEITLQAITRACANLCQPDTKVNNAVNVRRELDLRIGASFTRLQTLRLRKVFPDILGNQLISYGSCQFPTLGFVVERYKQVQAFIPEAFWKLKVTHIKDEITTEFSWKRGRLFDHTACLVLYQMCLEKPTARVTDIKSRNKSRWRPQPLDTVELEKLASRKLHMNAKLTMTVAEKLYTKGFISYPRTETTIFPKELNLSTLVQMQCEDPNWGDFANRVLQDGPNPRQGHKTDNAHPPIHPIKYTNTLQGDEKRIYEFVVRHFLACVSKDAEGRETSVEIEINEEKFGVNGLIITARNFLDVYPYERWNAKVIAEYRLNEIFQPSGIEMNESETSAPELLSEADLIALMEKHGIGTDATHAEHIETIKSRLYVGVNENGKFVPGELGMGLVEGYDAMGFQMSKPHLRAELEADLKRICEGSKDPKVVLQQQIAKYKEYFVETVRQVIKIDLALSSYFDVRPNNVNEDHYAPTPVTVMKCLKCSTGDITVRAKKDNKGYFLSCMSFPACKYAMWLPESLEQISVTDENCLECRPRIVKKLKLKFKPGSLMPFYGDEVVKCLGGCDPEFMEVIGCNEVSSRNSNSTSLVQNTSNRSSNSDRGYESGHHSSSSNSNYSNASFNNNATSSHNNNHHQQQQQRFSFPTSQPSQRRPLQPRFSPNTSVSNSNNDIVCSCGKKAVLFTVKKEGSNKGRQFYKCPDMSDETKCNFFLWKDDNPVQNNLAPPRSYSDSAVTLNTSAVPLCQCSVPAKLLTVNKDNGNKGRKFYACSKSKESGCGFFQWADETPPSSTTSTYSANNQWFTDSENHGQSRRRPNSTSGGTKSKRKCGVCAETGHNKKNCPRNR